MRPSVYSRKFVNPVFKSFDELFLGLDKVLGSDVSQSFLPAVNVTETDENFKIDLAAAGFHKEDFKVNTEKGNLIISAEAKSEETDKNVQYTRREFRHQSFKRTFKLPETVNTDEIVATYQNGILKLTLPKKEEVKALNKVIEVA